MTPQQDVLLTDVTPENRDAVEQLLRDHGVTLAAQMTPMAQYALSCPALPTCGLALTEAERMHPEIVGGIDALLAKHGLSDRRLSVRITGCPNGCARTYAGDIGIVGRMPGFYAVFVGGDFEGTRLNFKLLEKVAHANVISLFDPALRRLGARRCHRRVWRLLSSGRARDTSGHDAGGSAGCVAEVRKALLF